MKKVRLKKDFVIKAGTIFKSYGPVVVTYNTEHYSSILGISKDSIGEFILNSDCLDDRPDLFEEID